MAGDKAKGRGTPLQARCLESGVSYASINYRFRSEVPIQVVLRDSARAIQFLRSKAPEWNIDKGRVAACGGSAGAGTSLWLAFHDDLAEPKSDDPVARESTRLSAAGSAAGQATYDIKRWEEVIGKVALDKYHPRSEWPELYGLKGEDEIESAEGRRIRADVDMLGLISKGDAPVFLAGSAASGVPETLGQANHHPRHSIAVKEQCDREGVEAVLVLANRREPDERSLVDFLFEHLGVEATGKPSSAK